MRVTKLGIPKKLLLAFTIVLSIAVVLLPRSALAVSTFEWKDGQHIKVTNAKIYGQDLLNKSFVSYNDVTTTPNMEGKVAYYPEAIPYKLIEGSIPCSMFLELVFLNKEATLAKMQRSEKLASNTSSLLYAECARDNNKTYADLRPAIIGLPLVNLSNIPIIRPENLKPSSDNSGSGGGGAGGDSYEPPATVQCGTIPQEICDLASTTAPTTANPLGGLGNVLDWLINFFTGLFVAGTIVIAAISGVQISASAGNPEVIKNAKNNILKAVTALALIISARAFFSIFGIYDTGFAPPVTLFSKINLSNLSLNDFQQVLLNILLIAAFLSGIVSLIFIIIGGVRLTLSVGRPEAIKGAKNTLIYAIVGMIVTIMSYGIISFVVDALT